MKQTLFSWGQRLILTPAVFVLQLLFKRRKIIILSGRNGRSFADNSRYLFEFLIEHPEKDVQLYYYTKDKTLYDRLNTVYPGKILYAYHFKTLFIYSRAHCVVFSHGSGDVFPYPLLKTGGKKVINLFHAIPLKYIGFIEKFNDREKYIREMQKYDRFVVSSKEEADKFCETSFLIPEQMIVTGMPRNDLFFDGRQTEKGELFRSMYVGRKTILYAPTFRDDGRPVELFPFADKDLRKLDEFLGEQSAVILIRCHVDEFEKMGEQALGELKNIEFQGVNVFPDVQDILGQVDIVITDYSSICLDFLLTLRPMIFLPYDLEQYNSERGFMFEYSEATAGPKPKTQREFITCLENYLNDPELDKGLRTAQMERFHQYEKGRSCQNITSILLKEMEND